MWDFRRDCWRKPGLSCRSSLAKNGLEAAEQLAALQPDRLPRHQMPGLTGLEVAQGIEGTTRVVSSVTAFDEFAVAAFRAAGARLCPEAGEGRAPGAHRRALEGGHRRPAAGLLTRAWPLRCSACRLRRRRRYSPLRPLYASQGDLRIQIDVAEVLFFRLIAGHTAFAPPPASI